MILGKLGFLSRRKAQTVARLQERLGSFRDLVEKNDRVLELIAEASEKLGGEYIFDSHYLQTLADDLREAVHAVVHDLTVVTGEPYPELLKALAAADARIRAALDSRIIVPEAEYVIPLDQVGTASTDVVGEKMARLGAIRARLGCRVPAGFVVTTHACRHLLDEIGATESAEELDRLGEDDGDQLAQCAKRLQQRVRRATLPRGLSRAIRRGVTRLEREHRCSRFAVRSSAVGEDGESSFAGQYKTVLGVEPENVCSAFQEVVASLYDPHVVRYRLSRGLPPGRGVMAVGCLCLVPAEVSGVVYTLNPASVEDEDLLVVAARGLGKVVVEGDGAVDRFTVARQPPHQVVDSTIANKETMLVASSGSGLAEDPVDEKLREEPAVRGPRLRELAEMALRIERYMRCAQDIEWTVDRDGQLFMLQTRPLKLPLPEPGLRDDLSEIVKQYPVLLNNRGEVSCRGIAHGTVHVVEDVEAAEKVSPDTVLVARTATPKLAGGLSAASAVITDHGSSTGHLSAVAREFRVPMIVNTQIATEVLEDGVDVTVDAEENVVYRGRVEELLRYELRRQSLFQDKPEFRMLRSMLHAIAPLSLRDPQAPEFTAASCSTYHDVIRFAHETAITALTEGELVSRSSDALGVRRLALPIPLDLTVLDLGGGLTADAKDRVVGIDDVTSRPLRPLLEELTADGVWDTSPAAMDLNGFMSSATRSTPLTGPAAARPEPNLAIVSDRYLHLSLRLGYHFNIVDTYLTETRNDNYVHFRFAGGVTELARRSRRAALLKAILERYDFAVEGTGDLVIGRIKGVSATTMVARLRMLGRLIGFTRQLDIFLRDDTLVERYLEDFLTALPHASRAESFKGDG
jgi:pyruvate,water dikinase